MASNMWAIDLKFTIQYVSAVTGAPVKCQFVELESEEKLLEY